MMPSFLSPVVALIICATAVVASADSKTDRWFNQGLEYYQSGDYRIAYNNFIDAAKAGDSEAMMYVASIYYNGEGRPQDYGEAAYWYRRAAEKGEAVAMDNLALMYWNGMGVTQDHAAAVRWCQKALNHGSTNRIAMLGKAYFKGLGITQDYGQALHWFGRAAGMGDKNAMNSLGVMYSQGLGVNKNDGEAAIWFRQAAEAGSEAGAFNLAERYISGRGIAKSKEQARFWYQKAADAGNKRAKDELASMDEGDTLGALFGVSSKDEMRRIEVRDDLYAIKKDDPGGDPEQAIRVAEVYKFGSKDHGIEKDVAKAILWYQRAAELGHADTADTLGWIYRTGGLWPDHRAFSPDYTESVRWYRKAAESDHKRAMSSLAELYALGLGVERDYDQAKAWFTKSADEDVALSRIGQAIYSSAGAERDLPYAVECLSDYIERMKHQGKTSSLMSASITRYLCRRSLGDHEKAISELKEFTDEYPMDGIWMHIVSFLKGNTSGEKLLEQMRSHNPDLQKDQTYYANYFIGAVKLVEGDHESARGYLEKVVARRNNYGRIHDMAVADLTRLKP